MKWTLADLEAGNLPPALTIPQVAELLAISTWTVRDRIKSGQVPTVAGFKPLRIPTAALRAALIPQ